MPDVEVLHISDLHWNSGKKADCQIVVSALLRDLEESRRTGLIQPQALVFSGDLVLAGENSDEFSSAFDALLKPAIDILGLTTDALFISPGNHDIARSTVRGNPFVENGLSATLTSVDVLNAFIDDLNAGKLANLAAVERIREYYKFADTVMSNPTVSTATLRTYLRTMDGSKIGIACFDTAWRATGEADDVDKGRLLLGERNVDNAIEALNEADYRFAVMHHPLDWLAEFDEVAVSSRLSAGFDAIFCGHTHRNYPQTQITPQGTAILSQTGSVYAGRRWFNGYQTLQISRSDSEAEFKIRTYYDTPRREFDAATNVAPNGCVKFPFFGQKKK